jgi:hypothetical protein
MGEHRIPRDAAPLDPEVFCVHEEATNQIFNMRDLTDEQLERHIADANRQAKQFMSEGLKLIGISQTAKSAASCMEYEKDRRRRSVKIVTFQ